MRNTIDSEDFFGIFQIDSISDPEWFICKIVGECSSGKSVTLSINYDYDNSGFNGTQDDPKGPVLFQFQDRASQAFYWQLTLRFVRFSYNSLMTLITSSSMDMMTG